MVSTALLSCPALSSCLIGIWRLLIVGEAVLLTEADITNTQRRLSAQEELINDDQDVGYDERSISESEYTKGLRIEATHTFASVSAHLLSA